MITTSAHCSCFCTVMSLCSGRAPFNLVDTCVRQVWAASLPVGFVLVFGAVSLTSGPSESWSEINEIHPQGLFDPRRGGNLTIRWRKAYYPAKVPVWLGSVLHERYPVYCESYGRATLVQSRYLSGCCARLPTRLSSSSWSIPPCNRMVVRRSSYRSFSQTYTAMGRIPPGRIVSPVLARSSGREDVQLLRSWHFTIDSCDMYSRFQSYPNLHLSRGNPAHASRPVSCNGGCRRCKQSYSCDKVGRALNRYFS